MDSPIVIENSLFHVLVYGYFQHAYEIWYSMEKEIDLFSDSDLVLQIQLFATIRSKIRGFQSYNSPTPISGIAAMLGSGKNYPKFIYLTDGERHFYNKIVKLKFGQLEWHFNRYCRLTGFKKSEKAFSELITNLRTKEAVNFLMNKFRNQASSIALS